VRLESDDGRLEAVPVTVAEDEEDEDDGVDGGGAVEEGGEGGAQGEEAEAEPNDLAVPLRSADVLP
jgi:hypothetical protein